MTGLITDIFGDTKYARNALSFSTMMNVARLLNESIVVFVDTQGTFRPELVFSHLLKTDDSEKILKRIRTVRIFSSRFLRSVIKNSMVLRPRLIVIDNFISLFSSEYSRTAQHLSIMYHLRELARIAINNDVAIIITNPSVSLKAKNSYSDEEGTEGAYQHSHYSRKEEMFGRSVSIYTDIVVQLQRVGMDDSTFSAQLIKPANGAFSYVRIINGIVYESNQ